MRLSNTRPHSFFKYFGSKWSTVNDYPKPMFNTIIEPFAGSAQYSVRYWWYNIILSDIDSDIAGLWDWLIKASENDIITIPTKIDTGTNLLRVMGPHAANLVRRWQRTGHNDCWTVSTWNGLPGLWNERVKRRIASDLCKIRHWKVYYKPYWELENLEGTWFVDPPYQHLPGSYAYEGIDYEHLGKWCQTRKGQVIVCEREGADWLPFRPFRQITNLKREKANEVYWTNE